MTIRGNLTGVVSDLVEILHTRVELFSIELTQQRARLFSMLWLLGLSLVFLLLSLVVFSILIIALMWPTEFRYWGIGGLALAYALLGLGLLWRIVHRLKTEVGPFEMTRHELSQDASLLRAWHRASRSPNTQTTTVKVDQDAS